jgi:hypothetical protein
LAPYLSRGFIDSGDSSGAKADQIKNDARRWSFWFPCPADLPLAQFLSAIYTGSALAEQRGVADMCCSFCCFYQRLFFHPASVYRLFAGSRYSGSSENLRLYWRNIYLFMHNDVAEKEYRVCYPEA